MPEHGRRRRVKTKDRNARAPRGRGRPPGATSGATSRSHRSRSPVAPVAPGGTGGTEPGAVIEAVRTARGLSRQDVAGQAGITVDALRKIEVGDRTGRAETLARLAATLGITLADLYVEGPPVAPHAGEYVPLGDARPVPVIGWVEAGQFTPASDGDFLPGDADDYVYTTTPGRYLFALTISGDSMEPEFAAGDVILVAPDREPAPGDFVVAKLDDEGEATVKQYWPQGTGSDARIILRPLNPRHNDIVVGPDSGCRIIGKVVESKTLFPSGAPPPSTPCATPPYMVAEHAQSRSPGRALGRIVARVQEFAGEPAPSVAPAPTGPTSTSDVSHDDAPSPYAELSDWELMERIHERLAELDRAGLERLLAAVGDAHT